MDNLLTLNYWFALRPESLIPLAFRLFVGLIVLLIIITIIASINKKKKRLYRRFWRKTHAFAFTNTILGLILIFFNYESLPFFSSRFILGLWVLGMLVWIVFILMSLKVIPEKKEELAREQEYKKYLP